MYQLLICFIYLFAEQGNAVIQFKTIHALQVRRGSLLKESSCHLHINKIRIIVVIIIKLKYKSLSYDKIN